MSISYMAKGYGITLHVIKHNNIPQSIHHLSSVVHFHIENLANNQSTRDLT